MRQTREERLSPRLVLSVFATGFLSFAGVVIETATNVAFPTLMKEFDIGTGLVQWATTGYLLVLSLTIPASSYLKRRFSTRSLFSCAVVAFVLGLVAAACAPNFFWVLGGRLLQALGTGIALPLMFNIVFEQVPVAKLGLMTGVAMLVTAVAPAVGPSVGGLVVQVWGWRVLFALMIPIVLIVLGIGLATIRQVSEPEHPRFDLFGWLLLAVGFTAVLFATSETGTQAGTPQARVQTILLLLGAVVALGLFGLRAAHHTDSIIRVKVFRSPVFTLSVVTMMLSQFIVLALSYLLPNVAQLSWGTGALMAGCILLPGCALGAVIAPISGKIFDRFGARTPVLTGTLLLVVSTMLFVVSAHHANLVTVTLIYVVFALGQGLTVPTSMTNGLRHVDNALTTDANAVFNTMQQLAAALGTAVATRIVAAAQEASSGGIARSTLVGAQQVFVVVTIVAIAALVAGIFSVWSGKRARPESGR